MAQDDLVQRAKSLLDELAKKPRFAGSAEESEAMSVCRVELEHAGFVCQELPFEYSQWPGRWGPPISAALQAFTVLAVAHMAVHHGPLWALSTGAALLIALMLASGDARRRWTRRFPLQRATSANLEATRGNPSVWLAAHIDSKSQTVPMLVRVASGIALSAVVALSFIVPLLTVIGLGVVTPVWHVMALLAVLTALPAMFCFIRNESDGAVDNASGVVAVLLAAQAATAPNGLGVLITSGEELGLAGAREWVVATKPAGSAPSGIKVLNCDTVDDTGNWRCMHTGARPKRIAAAAETIAGAMGVRLPIGRLIPGILADSVAFADVGIESITLSRGTLSTLARIHTRRDTSNTLTGVGVAEASALLTALAKELG